MLVNPKESIRYYSGDEMFVNAVKEGKQICVYINHKGKVCYRTYDPNRKLSKKEIKARLKFAERSKARRKGE